MPERKPFISFDRRKCSGCVSLICIGVCPQGILEADAEGKPRIADVSACTLCGVCVNLCPQKAVTVNSGGAGKKGKR
ncbi:MAG TPA: 4Fe-4S dicluster domain-containing protein [Candidatus Bathyarchaeia archaeon]|nr:4Fe-4S dicluster domain-containing protein [Candidatus Bathyarchaeia archaeon]